MSFTPNQNLENAGDGQADWDTSLNSNHSILDRGYHATLTAGASINSLQVVSVLSGGIAMPYDATSADLGMPHAISFKAVSSGEATQFLMRGIIDGAAGLIAGAPVFVDPASLGYVANSYSAAQYPIGIALSATKIAIAPGLGFALPELVTGVSSGGALAGASFNFAMDLGRRGIVRKLRVVTDSCDAYKVQFFSGSARVSSERLYETSTTSVDGGASDFDVSSLDYVDAAMFPVDNTDTGSPGLIFGSILVQSASSVGSTSFGVTVITERFA